MSIETEITRISTNVSDTLSAVSEMGGEVPEGATSNDMAAGVRSIPVGAKIDDTTPSSTTTYSSQKIESELTALNDANAALIEVSKTEPNTENTELWIHPNADEVQLPQINDSVESVQDTWSSKKIAAEVSNKANDADLAAVAKSGSYTDLTNKPTIPTVPTTLPNPNKLKLTGAVTAEYDGSSEVSVEIPAGGGSGSYNLPIASATQLGGVMPVAKTDEMTQAVGVDGAGGLWTAPGSGSGGDWVEVGTVTLDEDVNVWNLDVSSVNPSYSGFDELRIEFVFLGTSSNTKENDAFIRARLNNVNSGSNATIKYASRISRNMSTLAYIEKSGGTLDTFITITNSGLSTSYVSGCHSNKITGFNVYCNSGSYIAAGSTAKIIGRGA